MRAKWGAVAGAMIVGVALIMGLSGVSGASSATTQVTATPNAGAGQHDVTLTSVGHDDNSTTITYNFTTSNVVTPASFDHVDWQFDLNNNGSVTDPSDGCIELSSAGTVLRASLFAGGACSGQTNNTADAAITPSGGGDKVQFSFPLQTWKTTLGFTGSSYKYRVTLVDFHGWTYVVQSSSAFVTHTLGGSATTTAPTTTAPTTTAPTTTAPTTTAPTTTAPTTTAPTTTARTAAGTTTDPTPTPTGNLPRTGANILYLLVGAGAFLYAGIELLGAKVRLDNNRRDE